LRVQRIRYNSRVNGTQREANVVNIILSACACLAAFTASGMVADVHCRRPQHLAYFAVGLFGLWAAETSAALQWSHRDWIPYAIAGVIAVSLAVGFWYFAMGLWDDRGVPGA